MVETKSAALEKLIGALAARPQVDALWAQFSDLIAHFNLRHPVPPEVQALLARALEHPAVDPGSLVRPISTLALSRPAGTVFDEPLLLRLLEGAVIRDATLERLIAEKRRALLEEALAAPTSPAALAVALAHQCFNTEYVFGETPEESAQVDRLRDAITSAASPAAFQCAVYAAYRPLHTLGKTLTEPHPLVRRQMTEPATEARLRATIASLGASDDPVSAAVRAQYEANPYPRWVRTPSAGFAAPRELAGRPRILIAGCGTGQHVISAAGRFPGTSILALDLSLASLAYAKRKTLEAGLANIEYRQGDLLALVDHGERFDLIECSGVLHHMGQPFEGWRVLDGLLKPGGMMRVGLYSELGRRSVVRARELIAAEGFTSDERGIRACRAAIRARESDELLARIARNEDFYSMSGCRDLLFHVQEHRFTLPQIESMIKRLGRRFLGFEFPDGGETLERFRARSMDPLQLQSWHRFEQEFPDTFSRMYQFWVA